MTNDVGVAWMGIPLHVAYPALSKCLSAEWWASEGARSRAAARHRVYRWLEEASESNDAPPLALQQLAALELLVARNHDHPIFADLVDQLFRDQDENRVDSLATEMLLFDHLLRNGHQIEPAGSSGKRPEFIVDGGAAVEAKSYCPPAAENKKSRLIHELTKRLKYPILVSIDGQLGGDMVQVAIKVAKALKPSQETVVVEVGEAQLRVSLQPGAGRGATSWRSHDLDGSLAGLEKWAINKASTRQLAGAATRVLVLEASYPPIEELWALRPRCALAAIQKASNARPKLQIVPAFRRHLHFGELAFPDRTPSQVIKAAAVENRETK